MDKTLDQYIEDLREANKQADIRKMQMQTMDLFPSDRKIDGEVDVGEASAPICNNYVDEDCLLSGNREGDDIMFYQNDDFLEGKNIH